MKGVLEGAVNPSLASVVEHIRKGTLDLVLLKPADAQFLVSTAKFAPWHVVDVVAGAGVVAWAFAAHGALARAGGRGVALLLTRLRAWSSSTRSGSWWSRRPSSW